jgi:hypothetical protein
MPAALPKLKLSELSPSEEEVRAARDNLKKLTDKEILSRKASLRAYIKQNPDNIGKGDMGALLEKFSIMQARAKDSQKKVKSVDVDSTATRQHRELHWWAQEEMEKNLGEKKATRWRESGLLPSRPDRVTGDAEDPFKEYGVPKDWEQITEEALKALRIEFESVAEADDLLAIQGFRSKSAVASSSIDPVEKTELEVMNEAIDTLKANVTQVIARMQAMVLSTKVIKTKAESEKNEYHAALIADCVKLISQGEKVVKILERMALEEPNMSEMPKVLKLIQDTSKKEEIVTQWATTYGFNDSAAKRRKKIKK